MSNEQFCGRPILFLPYSVAKDTAERGAVPEGTPPFNIEAMTGSKKLIRWTELFLFSLLCSVPASHGSQTVCGREGCS